MTSTLDLAIREIFGVFPFLQDDDLASCLDARRKSHIAGLLEHQVTQDADGDATSQCLNMLGDMTSEEIHNLLRSPALCEILRTRQGMQSLHDLLRKELDPSAAPLSMLDCGIAIDESLPDFLSNPGSGLVRPRALTSNEHIQTLDSLNRASDLFRSQSELGYSLYSTLTTNIVLRVDDMRLGEVWGASSAMAIGRLVIVNGHNSKSDYLLTDILLHETVHNTLSCIDLMEPLAGFDRSLLQLRFNSPWSGNPLHIHAFLHATVVWSLLSVLWKSVKQDHACESLAIDRIEYISKGFSSNEFDSAIGSIQDALPAATSSLLFTAKEIAMA